MQVSIYTTSYIMRINSKNELRNLWEIYLTGINISVAINYYRHNYCKNMVNDYQLK